MNNLARVSDELSKSRPRSTAVNLQALKTGMHLQEPRKIRLKLSSLLIETVEASNETIVLTNRHENKIYFCTLNSNVENEDMVSDNMDKIPNCDLA